MIFVYVRGFINKIKIALNKFFEKMDYMYYIKSICFSQYSSLQINFPNTMKIKFYQLLLSASFVTIFVKVLETIVKTVLKVTLLSLVNHSHKKWKVSIRFLWLQVIVIRNLVSTVTLNKAINRLPPFNCKEPKNLFFTMYFLAILSVTYLCLRVPCQAYISYFFTLPGYWENEGQSQAKQ